MTARPFHLLVVEDNSTDVMIMREALAHARLQITLHTAADGVIALEFLRRMGPHSQAPRPDLILLDLNMPRKNGHEVLAEIKADGALMTIPVVVLTTSGAEDDIAKAYDAHANCYIRKPADFERFTEVVNLIEQFWFTVVTPPKV